MRNWVGWSSYKEGTYAAKEEKIPCLASKKTSQSEKWQHLQKEVEQLEKSRADRYFVDRRAEPSRFKESPSAQKGRMEAGKAGKDGMCRKRRKMYSTEVPRSKKLDGHKGSVKDKKRTSEGKSRKLKVWPSAWAGR